MNVDTDKAFLAGGKYDDADNENRKEKQTEQNVLYNKFVVLCAGSPLVSFRQTCHKEIDGDNSVHKAGGKYAVAEASAFEESDVIAEGRV